MALVHEKIPEVFMEEIDCSFLGKPITYRQKWILKLPIFYSYFDYVVENFNENCIENLLDGQKFPCLSPIQDQIAQIPTDVKFSEARDDYTRELFNIIASNLSEDQLYEMEQHHWEISYALGQEVGVIKTKQNYLEHLRKKGVSSMNSIQKWVFNQQVKKVYSLCEVHYATMFKIIKKEELDKVEEGPLVGNKSRVLFFNLLNAKEDNCVLLNAGTLLSMLTLSKVSPALLYRSNLYPIGFRRRNMLLQKLINANDQYMSSPLEDQNLLGWS
mmetsp:Transcript_33943/g.33085  ORF Transcript_33943/g.33085 Transcript_33943/m.33085 type:complete len:272 (+) Transcript_33943:295-1110(+)